MGFPDYTSVENDDTVGEQVRHAARRVAGLSTWIDQHPPNREESFTAQLWSRCGKVGEEFGEVIEEIIRHTGQNPRKDSLWSLDKVDKELCDVILTALGAMQHLRDVQGFAGDPIFETLFAHVEAVSFRAGLE
jgi:NTP pyrophosphatase (non-canonical NTP hydrolase)